MKKILFLLISSLCVVLANNIPKPSTYDKKIAFAVFNANDVLQINAANGYVSVIEFAKNERIINISIGFSEGWETIERDNLLFIKPKAYVTKLVHSENPEDSAATSDIVIDPNPSQWKTNLIVTTNVNFYVFDLTLSYSKRIYKVSFTYPEKEKQNIQVANKLLEKQIEEDKLETSLNRSSVPRNWDFYMKVNKGSDEIIPSFAYDDGVFTYLGFDNTKTFPSAFAYDNGQESILNTHIKQEGNYTVLVIQRLVKQIFLRSGDKLVGIFNNGYGKNPLPNTQQTSNDDEVVRELKNGKRK